MASDTHCHLDAEEFDHDRDDVVKSAQENGISQIIVPAVSILNLDKVKGCCVRYALCKPAYGIHPLYVKEAHDENLKELFKYVKDEMSGNYPPVALGEMGLDFFVENPDVLRQEFFFTQQLKMAREFDLPVLLHVRRSVDSVLKFLRRFGIRKGIAHAFNGSLQQAEAFIRLGFKLGFGGAMTYPRATRIRELARSLPLESIVLETDAPDIPPVWLNKARNTPSEILKIAQCLADLRRVEINDISDIIDKNVDSVLHGASTKPISI